MMKMMVAAAALAACVGCASNDAGSAPQTVMHDGKVLNRIPGVDSVVIPAGVSDAAALDVIEQVVALNNGGDRRNRWNGEWRMEDRDPQNKWIQVGFSVREHYVCVCYRIEGGKLVPDVPTSTNLKQNGTRIHRKVPVWINGLRPQISERLYRCAKGVAPEK